jgi:ketosteroid isomerase-like protein
MVGLFTHWQRFLQDNRKEASDISHPEEVVRRFNSAWIVGDVESVIQLVAEDCVYALHISEELLPFGGETCGRANIKSALQMMRHQFDYLLYRPGHPTVVGSKVHNQVEFMYRHRKSGEVLTGTFRIVLQVKDGLLVRGDEYHDRAMVETFMRLFAG